MADSNRSIHFLCRTNSSTHQASVSFAQERPDRTADRQQLSFNTSTAGKSEAVSFSTGRCSEKGCVFPASSLKSGKCSYHMRQQEEPVLFRSHQPTGLFLDPARTGPADQEYDASRKRDRRRMTELWEQFQSDGTA